MFSWIGWLVILFFFWPLLLFAWVVPLAIRSAANDDREGLTYRCADESLNSCLSGFVGVVAAAAVTALAALAAEQVPQNSTGAAVAVMAAWGACVIWVGSLMVGSVTGAVHAGSTRVWRCVWSLPLTRLHRDRRSS